MITWSIVVFVVGFLVRLALALANRPTALVEQPEPVQIALSLLSTGRYADAYGAGSGLTAHCAPLHPLLLSLMFKIFGTGADGALAMKLLGGTAASLTFALLPALSIASGLGLLSGVLAGMAGALVPANFSAQNGGTFDAPFTSAAVIVLFILISRVWRTAQFTIPQAIAFGVVAGVGCLFNPALIPILAAWLVVSVARYKLQWRRVLAFFAVAAVLILLILAPWAIRNYNALGSLIWTRSNFGLELQVSNNDLVKAHLERNVETRGFAEMHPFTGANEHARVARLGEVAYNRSKREQAFAWIASHPRHFLVLTAERFWMFWFPTMHRPWQTLFEDLLTVLGLCGLVLVFLRRNAFAWLVLAAFAAYPVIYYVIQSSPRYRFPLEPILFLLAAKLASVLLTRGSVTNRTALDQV